MVRDVQVLDPLAVDGVVGRIDSPFVAFQK